MRDEVDVGEWSDLKVETSVSFLNKSTVTCRNDL